MKNNWIPIIVVAIVILGVGLGAFYARDAKGISNFEECAAAGFPIMESFPRQCSAEGKTFVETIAPQEANIRVTSPQPNEEIGLPLVIQGEARVFENTFLYRLRDEDGTVLVEGFDTADAPDIGQFGPFTVSTMYSAPKGTRGTLEVFSDSAKDGSEINKVIIPVRFRSVESITVKVFFPNSERGTEAEQFDCAKVYPLERRIAKTQATARAALLELLKGPTITESRDGHFTNINSGVVLQSLTIVNGVARADFNETLGFQVGGSCRVTSIRAQIERTLKQFSTVQSVIISIDGRTEDILQP